MFLDSTIPYATTYLEAKEYLTEYIDENDTLVIVFEIPVRIHEMALSNSFHLLTKEEKKTIIQYTCLDYGNPTGVEGEVYVQPIILAILRHPLFEKMFGSMPKNESWIRLSEDDYFQY